MTRFYEVMVWGCAILALLNGWSAGLMLDAFLAGQQDGLLLSMLNGFCFYRLYKDMAFYGARIK